jgi:integron integrase
LSTALAAAPCPLPQPALLRKVREALRARHRSPRTEEAYVGWMRQYVLFHERRDPAQLGAAEIRRFLAHLAVERKAAPATRNQALAAVLFLHRHVLLQEPAQTLDGLSRAPLPRRAPVALSPGEVERLLQHVDAAYRLPARLLYASGLRLMECVRLRVKDLDFSRASITVRDTRDRPCRVTALPSGLEEDLHAQVERVSRLHERDLAAGFGEASLPPGLVRRGEHDEREPGWQFLFPAARRARDARSGLESRRHLHETLLQRAVRSAARAAALDRPGKPVSCHTLRHSCAVNLLARGLDADTVQELLGHRDSATVTLYRRLVAQTRKDVVSHEDC